MLRSTLIVTCLISVLSNAAWVHATDWHSLTSEQIIAATKERVTVKHSYRLDTEIRLELPMEQAALLAVEPNPHGLKEVILCPYDCEGPRNRPADRGGLWHNLIFDDGYFRTHGKFLYVKEMFQTYGAAPDLGFNIKWEVKGDKVFIKYRALSGKEELFQIKKSDRNPQGNFISQEERVIAFVKLWSEIKYNFAFFDQVPELDWDGVLEEYLPKVLKDQTLYEYNRLLQKLVAKLHDGHTSVNFRGGFDTSDVCYDYLPLRVKPIDGKITVVEPGKNKEIAQAGLRTGDEITHIDGRSVQEILEEDIYPYIFASTPQDREKKAFESRFECSKGPIDSKARLRICSVDGEVREVTLTRRTRGKEMPWLRKPFTRSFFEFKELENGIVYVLLGSFGSRGIVEQFDEVFDKILKAKGLIIDVRENGGGSTDIGYAIISYLTDKPLKGSHWKTRQYMPAFHAWGKKEQWYEADHDTVMPRKEGTFDGPIVVLTGPDTYSAAEDFVVVLHASGRATLAGEKTGGSTGQPLIVRLPGGPEGGMVKICTKRDTYPDGREFVGVGIIPDVEIHPSPADIATDRDVVLEKALEVLRAKTQ